MDLVGDTLQKGTRMLLCIFFSWHIQKPFWNTIWCGTSSLWSFSQLTMISFYSYMSSAYNSIRAGFYVIAIYMCTKWETILIKNVSISASAERLSIECCVSREMIVNNCLVALHQLSRNGGGEKTGEDVIAGNTSLQHNQTLKSFSKDCFDLVSQFLSNELLDTQLVESWNDVKTLVIHSKHQNTQMDYFNMEEEKIWNSIKNSIKFNFRIVENVLTKTW